MNSAFHWVKSRVLEQRRRLLLIFFASVLSSAATLAIPLIVGRLVEAFEQRETAPEIIALALGVLFVRLVAQLLSSYGMTVVTLETLRRARQTIFRELLHRPVDFHDALDEGEKVSRVMRDVDVVINFATGSPIGIATSFLTFGGAIVLMARLDLTLTLMVAILGPAAYIVARVVGRKVRSISREFWAARSQVLGIVQETARIVRVLKAFGRESYQEARFVQRLDAVVDHGKRRGLVMSTMGPVVQFLTFAGLVLVVMVATYSGEGNLSVDELVSFILFGLLLTTPLRSWVDTYGSYESARAALDRLASLFDAPSEDLFDSPDDPGPRAAGRIAFDGVTFGYPGRPIRLEHVELLLEAGTTAALVGPNGAGKTTIGHLLLRFYDPLEGRILLDDTDLREYTLGSLRRQIGLVPQQSPLISGTIRDNLLLGDPSASTQDLHDALTLVEAADFIGELEHGLDTPIGDDGIRLSGGQRQRLAIARVALEDAPVIILDEATSMFDPEAESRFVERILEQWKTKTVIIITHRPTTLSLVDLVLRVDGGRVQTE